MEVSEEEQEDFTPRNYQVEMMEIAMKQNTIIFLPTGSGKTFIALMVMKRMAADLISETNKKNTVILVNTLALVEQHTKYVRDRTTFSVSSYSGDMNVDYWSKDKWEDQFNKYQVLVMTSQILFNIVSWKLIDLDRINLIVFDECHRGVNDQPMRQLMKHFEHLSAPPRVLGLTATLLNGNCTRLKVMQEVRDLEITFHSKVATVDGLDKVVGYSTNPHEILEAFSEHRCSVLETEAMVVLEKLALLLEKVQLPSDREKNHRTLASKDLKPLDPAQGIKKVTRLIKDLVHHIAMLGAYGGEKACKAYMIRVEQLKKHCDEYQLSQVLCYVQTVLGNVKTKFEKQMSDSVGADRIKRHSSDKVRCLFKVLHDYYDESKEAICGLIFVQRRFTAKIVHHMLTDLAQYEPKFHDLRSNFMVGFNNNPFSGTRESLFITKKNKQVLETFVNKEINILVASDVLEEGVDIPKCTFVCKFDKPNDYRSYVQSKGRARHKSSRYYMLVEREKLKNFVDKYHDFKEVENVLNNFLIGKNDEREKPSLSEIDSMYNEHILPPFYVDGPGSAKVDMVSAIPLLCIYCGTLPGDEYTSYTPEWYISFDKEKRCYVTIFMPMVCPLLDPIVGQLMDSKKDAKRAAALKACIELFKKGELDRNLKPLKRVITEEDVTYLFSHYPKEKEPMAGTGKMKRTHQIKVAACTTGQILPSRSVYLHLIEYELEYTRNIDNLGVSTLDEIYTADLSYGLVTSKPLPSICDFPIYVRSGSINVALRTNSKIVELDAHQIRAIRAFHFLVFNDVLEILQPFLVLDNSIGAESVYVVPVRKGAVEIDFDVLKTYKTIKNRFQEPTNKDKMALEVDDAGYLRKVVTPWYRRDTSTYIVTKVEHDMTPNSPFPNQDYTSFNEYYMEKHQQRVFNQRQHMLLVKGLTKSLNYVKPRGRETKRKKEKLYEDMEEHLVPELLVKQDFPAELWIQASFLPTVLSRIAFLLRLDELRNRIAADCRIPMSGKGPGCLKLNVHLLDYDPALEEKKKEIELPQFFETGAKSDLLALEGSSLMPSVYNKDYTKKMLEAQYPWKDIEEPKDITRELDVTVMDVEYYENFISSFVDDSKRTLKNTSPAKNRGIPALTYDKDFVPKQLNMLNERRLEMPELELFYEAMTTAKANDIVNLERLETLGDSFLKYVSSLYIMLKFPQFDEGRATSLKGRLVSNKNLYYLAVGRNLNSYLKNADLSPREEFLPPGFRIPPVIAEKIDDKSLPPSHLFMVSVPDEEQLNGELTKETIEQNFDDNSGTTPSEAEEDNTTVAAFFNRQTLGDKVIADTVEALLGAHFQKAGFIGGIRFMEWMNIIPASENLLDLIARRPESPLIDPATPLSKIHFHIPLWAEIESILGYKFKNRAYLLQALTHASYTPNRLTRSYEKLEFLGDAVLDFLITCFIYESCDRLDPGALTDLRSALVNNNTFASFVVRCGFHKFLLMINSKLQAHVDKFAQYLQMKDYRIDDEVLILLEEDDMNIAEYVDVPKTLGDLFEALAGAVFLDSGYDLKTVWNVFYKIMWREIDLFSQNVPKNIVRRLYECKEAYPVFSKANPCDNFKTMVSLQFALHGRLKIVHGFGTNKAMAKKAAAKLALRFLNK